MPRSKLTPGGSVAHRMVRPVTQVTSSPYTIQPEDSMLRMDTGTSPTLICPSSASMSGQTVVVAPLANGPTLNRTGTDLIYSRTSPNGGTSLTLSGGTVFRLRSDGNGRWYVMERII